MPYFSPDQAYDLLRSVVQAERDARAKAEAMLSARDQLIGLLDGQPGIRRAGLAAAAGLSRARVTQMLNHELDPDAGITPELRSVVLDLRPDLGRIRSVHTRAS